MWLNDNHISVFPEMSFRVAFRFPTVIIEFMYFLLYKNVRSIMPDITCDQSQFLKLLLYVSLDLLTER